MAVVVRRRKSVPPLGYCECGCGQKTAIATSSNANRGMTAGVPKRFVRGHYARTRNPVVTAQNAKCKHCGEVKERRGTARLCSACLAVSPRKMEADRARGRIAECPIGMRWCTYCDEFLPLDVFLAYSPEKNGCRPCLAELARSANLARKFGISVVEYDAMLDGQRGVCAICGRPPKSVRLHVDHDHKTGLIRGLLCPWCNYRLLSSARDSVAVLRAAAAYLENPPAIATLGAHVVPVKPKKKRRRVSPAT